MQLLNIIRARAIWLIYFNDINPYGKNISPHFIPWLIDKYKFLKFPSSIYERDESQALAFLDGTFQGNNGTDISVNLSVYNDGFIADTRSSTKDTDTFIEDALFSFINDFRLTYKPEMLRKKLYVSELNLRTDRPLSGINGRMQAFVNKMKSMVEPNDDGLLEFSSLQFWWDTAIPNGQSNFQFERVAGTPFSERRYYSRAPLQTEDHLSLLNEFEDLLIG